MLEVVFLKVRCPAMVISDEKFKSGMSEYMLHAAYGCKRTSP